MSNRQRLQFMKRDSALLRAVKALLGNALLTTCLLGGGLVVFVWSGKPEGGHRSVTSFSFNPELGIGGPATLVAADHGLLFGTGCARPEAVFSFDVDQGRAKILRSFSPEEGGLVGLNPSLITAGPVLFGTTAGGGASGRGTIFRIHQDGTDYRVIHEFGEAPETGMAPLGSLLLGSDENLYGTTFCGGQDSGGVLFRIDQDGSHYKVLHYFDANTHSGVITGPNGLLYGTTVNGGSFRAGSLYAYDLDRREHVSLYEFGYRESGGSHPYGALTVLPGGKLVGTTSAGGKYGCGTIFVLNPDQMRMSIIHHFRGHDGAFPQSELRYASDGFLYGTAPGGGDLAGTLFRLKPDGRNFRVLHTFGSSEEDGAKPISGVVFQNERLYGATPDGGANGRGALFSARLLP